MTTINWGRGQSGDWTTAADWAGGVRPKLGDTGVIAAASSTPYTVTISSPVSVAGVVLDQVEATLLIAGGTLTSPAIDLQAGTLALGGASVSGTVTDTGASVLVGAGSNTLDDVTWRGALNVGSVSQGRGRGTLTIQNGLTLTGIDGSGAGSATFASNVVFSNVAMLDNAVLKGQLTSHDTIVGTTPLTLGSHLTFNGFEFSLTAGQSVVNDGTMGSGGFLGGTLTNNGTIVSKGPRGVDRLFTDQFTNNGLIVTSGIDYLNIVGLNAAGANGRIDLQSGLLVLAGGALTTAELRATYAAQHVTGSGTFGFGVQSGLDNTGQTLDIGKGTNFGTIYRTTVTGGILIDHGGDTLLNDNLTNVTYQSASLTVSAEGTWNNVTVTGATTLDDGGVINGGTLSGVGTVTTGDLSGDSNLALNGVDITGVAGSGKVLVDLTDAAGTLHSLEIGQNQSVSGYTIDISGANARLYIDAGAVVDNATVTFANSTSAGDLLWYFPISSLGVTFGSHLVLDVTASGAVDLSTDQGLALPALVNMGHFNVAGTLSLGQYYSIYNFDNRGSIDISAGGTFLAGTRAGSMLTNSGTIAATDAVVNLGLGVDNNGQISASFTKSPGTATIDGTLTGTGTIALGGAATLSLGATVAAGQLVALGHGNERLLFSNQAADTGFGGTIGGFAAGDAIEFTGKTVAHASFVGSSIVATLSTGGTIALTTTTALTGTLSVANAGGNAIVTYGAIAGSLQDWSAAPRAEASAWAATEGGHAGVPWAEFPEGHGLFGHHAILQA